MVATRSWCPCELDIGSLRPRHRAGPRRIRPGDNLEPLPGRHVPVIHQHPAPVWTHQGQPIIPGEKDAGRVVAEPDDPYTIWLDRVPGDDGHGFGIPPSYDAGVRAPVRRRAALDASIGCHRAEPVGPAGR